MAYRRSKMSGSGSRKHFAKHASYVHRKNTPGARMVMRGGIRL